jgi:2-oxoglutarate dehydrogenase E1 component
MPADLTPAYHGFSDADLDRMSGSAERSVSRRDHPRNRRLPAANYCGTVGVEYMHINDLEERRFIQERIEGKAETVQFTPNGKQAILAKVIQASSGRNSSPANMSAPSVSGSTAARARFPRSKR